MINNVFYDHQIFLKQKYGGPSRYFVELHNHLDPNIFKKKIIAPIHINRYLKNSDVNDKNIFLYKKLFFNNFLKKYNQILTLKKIKNNEDCIVHSTYYDLGYLRNQKCKKIVTIYDLIHEKFYPNKILPKEDNKLNCINEADFFICISKTTQKDFIEKYNIDKNKTKVIYLSSSLNKTNFNYKKKKDYILFVGNRGGYKNANFLIKAYAKNEKIHKNFNLAFFGGQSFSRIEIQNFKDLCIQDKIIYLGKDENKLSSFYQNASCLVYPSLYEGFGIPLLEAMESECPVICCDTPAIKEVGDNSVLYFEKDDLDSLINCMENLLHSNHHSNKLKNLGKIRRNNFSWKRCAKETEEIYLNI